MKLSTKKRVLGLVLVAFVLRTLFTVYGASVYYGLPIPFCYSFGDVTSYYVVSRKPY